MISEAVEHAVPHRLERRGLDMEAFGFMKAAELSGKRLHVFCAKVVVDKAGAAKGDEIHEYGAYVSARFTLDMVGRLLGT